VPPTYSYAVDGTGCGSAWSTSLSEVIDGVYRRHPELVDHRLRFPWLEGFLGDPNSPVWFIEWYPSTRAVKSIHSPSATCEAQWLATSGDKLFRSNLIRTGLKSGSVESSGGWQCYITDLVKADALPAEWDSSSPEVRRRAYESWLPVLTWEFANGKPEVVVASGHAVAQRLTDIWPALESASGRRLKRAQVLHHAFFNRGGDTPTNRARYAAEFDAVMDLLKTIRTNE
jgi:hypothetical protein